jgi:hypothetical protein
MLLQEYQQIGVADPGSLAPDPSIVPGYAVSGNITLYKGTGGKL